jgi:uncharacterized protein YbjQ (UPF0145 family)
MGGIPMILTTTHELNGRTIQDYLGIVVGETILATNIFRDIGAGLRDLVGGRSGAYEKKMNEARETASKKWKRRARRSAPMRSSASTSITRLSATA